MKPLKFVGRRFWRALPDYLAENYWWAYLWRPAIWFFDHQLIINLILFGQYANLVKRTVAALNPPFDGRFLQLTCVYGHLSQTLQRHITPQALYLADVTPAQLNLTRQKLLNRAFYTQMNSEWLAYANDSFDDILIFFLLHEQPRQSRIRTLTEAVRTVKPGGSIVITEYAYAPGHGLIKNPISRFLLCHLEPFLWDFWHFDLDGCLRQLARNQGKSLELTSNDLIFKGFYRISRYRAGSS